MSLLVDSYWKVSDRIYFLQVRLEEEYEIEKTGEMTMKLRKREQYRCKRVTVTKPKLTTLKLKHLRDQH